jgi:ketosteroid isomerase-like protein
VNDSLVPVGVDGLCWKPKSAKVTVMLEALFQTIDAKDPTGFLDFITDDCTFRFANLPEVTGAERIREFLASFYASIEGLSHVLHEHWEIPGGITCHGFVTYSRRNGTRLRVPFSVILKTREGRICEYLIFADTSAL